jgi:hypothetical protein
MSYAGALYWKCTSKLNWELMAVGLGQWPRQPPPPHKPAQVTLAIGARITTVRSR